jgi:hypothetical protein
MYVIMKRIFCICGLTFFLTSCALSGDVITGKVLDQDTGKPVPNAMVYVAWHGVQGGLFNSTSFCYHFGLSVSDSNGNFSVPAWRNESMGIFQSFFISNRQGFVGVYATGYKPEYVAPVLDGWFGGYSYKISPETRKSTEKFLAIFNVGESRCALFDKESAKNISMLLQATYKDAQKIATTAEDERLLGVWLSKIDNVNAASR